MCVIFLSFRQHPRYRLVVAANRDEFRDRPTEPVHWWRDEPSILAGRDLRSGGTWMGVHRAGRFAALTNFRDAAPPRERAPSRGELVTSFLRSDEGAEAWLAELAPRSHAWAGFSLFVSDLHELAHLSNRRPRAEILSPGIWAISNGLLGDPWPKVSRGKAEFARLLTALEPDRDLLMRLLRDDVPADEPDLPDTGVGLERERELSPIFIRGEEYGTRASTLLMIGEGGDGSVVEQQWGRGGEPLERVELEFQLDLGAIRES